LYELPVIHKAGVPLRSIITTTTTTTTTMCAPTYRVSKYLASLLGLHLPNSLHHVRNSEDFLYTLATGWVQPNSFVVSFDVIPLFTRVPVGDSLMLLNLQFDEGK
jgi:hypothetical protein